MALFQHFFFLGSTSVEIANLREMAWLERSDTNTALTIVIHVTWMVYWITEFHLDVSRFSQNCSPSTSGLCRLISQWQKQSSSNSNWSTTGRSCNVVLRSIANAFFCTKWSLILKSAHIFDTNLLTNILDLTTEVMTTYSHSLYKHDFYMLTIIWQCTVQSSKSAKLLNRLNFSFFGL